MNSIKQESDGNWHWDCPIDKDYHQKSGKKGLWGVLLICAVVFIIFFAVSHSVNEQNDVWIPFFVSGVILVIAIPLLLLWNSAADPHEHYVMSDDYVKSGYGKSSIYTEFKKTKEVIITDKYVEMIGKYRNNRIYIPAEDKDFLHEFILKHLPADVTIRNK